MIEVVATLYPQGDRSRGERLGVIRIVNDGTGTLHSGNYDVEINERGTKDPVCGFVGGFPRLTHNVWDLLKWALEDIL